MKFVPKCKKKHYLLFWQQRENQIGKTHLIGNKHVPKLTKQYYQEILYSYKFLQFSNT